ncbi:MAG TPA: alanine racemase [Marmoricola sp.]|nr:alanine racemase [Marmoricola sp.]
MDLPATSARAEIVVDLGAIRHNVRRLRELVSTGPDPAPALMVVVKADGYGHGMIPVALAARAAGAEWLGVATADEALALRDAGDTGRILSWLAAPGDDYRVPIAEDVDVTAYSVAELRDVAEAARAVGRVARVQLKVDTGLSRGGAPRDQWVPLFEAARKAEVSGEVTVTGLWSHFACSDEPEHPANDAQETAFREALALATDAGLSPEVRHLSNSAAGLLRPSSRFDLVRFGIAAYGLAPAPGVASSDDLGLVPAMTLRGRVVMGKDLEAGAGVSYGHTFVADRPMHVALVPMGYGDGIPRAASSRAEVQIRGERCPVLGRICMDQFVVASAAGQAGDEVLVFGSGSRGEPTAQDWAEWCDTINYEIVTRIAGRQRRVWLDPDGVTQDVSA